MKIFRKDVINLALPIFAEQFFVMFMGMINTMMASHIGKEAVASIGMVDSVNNIFIAFFSALSVGGMVVVAQYVGKGNIKEANAAMKQALYTGVMISLIITIFIFIFKNYIIAALFGAADPRIIANAHTYLTITLLTYPLITIDLVANGILRGAGDTKTPMKITIFMNFVNVVLTYSFINIFNLGIEGAALGIALARTSGGVIILTMLIRGNKLVKLKDIRKFKFNGRLLSMIFGVGIPASIESLLFNCGKLITQIYIVDMGTIAIASNAIAASIGNMLNIPGNSLCTAATALVGQNMGRGETDKAEKTLSYILKFSTLCLITVCILFLPFIRLTVSAFSPNSEIISLTSKVLLINTLFIPVWSLSFILPSGLKGAGDTKYTLFTTLIGMWVFRITLGYILGVHLKFGLVGVWMGMFTDWAVRGTLYLIRFKKGEWKKKRVLKTA